MELTIPDDLLKQAGLDERDVLIEFACMLVDMGKASLSSAAELAGLDDAAMQREVSERSYAARRKRLELTGSTKP